MSLVKLKYPASSICYGVVENQPFAALRHPFPDTLDIIALDPCEKFLHLLPFSFVDVPRLVIWRNIRKINRMILFTLG